MPRKFIPLYIKLDPKLGKALAVTVKSQSLSKREVIETALIQYLAASQTKQEAQVPA